MTDVTLSESDAFIAGGTTLVDLMKLGVVAPASLIDLNKDKALNASISLDETGLTIGTLATMTDVAEYSGLSESYPAIAQALLQAASPQIRNMATIGGNLLQRTRCSYFRDAASACNKRMPGAGCDALQGDPHGLAVLGRSPACAASYAGDLAVALTAMDAQLTCVNQRGDRRKMAINNLYCLPDDTPHIETNLDPLERIVTVHIPKGSWTHASYTKLRDRASYAFARASVALCLRIGQQGTIDDVAIALGGLATRPWRCRPAEDLLRGSQPDSDLFTMTAEACFTDADGDPGTIAIGHAAVRAALTRATAA